jgi:hypothetical protein
VIQREQRPVSELDANDGGRARGVPLLVIAVAVIAVLAAVGVGLVRSEDLARGRHA